MRYLLGLWVSDEKDRERERWGNRGEIERDGGKKRRSRKRWGEKRRNRKRWGERGEIERGEEENEVKRKVDGKMGWKGRRATVHGSPYNH